MLPVQIELRFETGAGSTLLRQPCCRRGRRGFPWQFRNDYVIDEGLAREVPWQVTETVRGRDITPTPEVTSVITTN